MQEDIVAQETCGIFYEYNTAGHRIKRHYDCQPVPNDDNVPMEDWEDWQVLNFPDGPSEGGKFADNQDSTIQVSFQPLDITVSPNPTAGNINISVPSSDIISHYHLKDATGKSILKGNIFSRSHHLNLSDLPAGIYFLIVYHGNLKEGFKIVKH
ncbi:MAG: T9SS type A sorting domain-containing protein [Chitinophagaceae bacterium]|nr:MAG: T9SS type A sorting domain-containing protein [Chitinophagaceae bacterium]